MKLNLVCCWKVEQQGGGEDTSKAVELLKEALQIAESRCGGWFRTTVPFLFQLVVSHLAVLEPTQSRWLKF